MFVLLCSIEEKQGKWLDFWWCLTFDNPHYMYSSQSHKLYHQNVNCIKYRCNHMHYRYKIWHTCVLSVLRNNAVLCRNFILSEADEQMSMEHWRKYLQGEKRHAQGRPVQVSLCPPQIPHWVAWNWTWISTETDKWPAEPWQGTNVVQGSLYLLMFTHILVQLWKLYVLR